LERPSELSYQERNTGMSEEKAPQNNPYEVSLPGSGIFPDERLSCDNSGTSDEENNQKKTERQIRIYKIYVEPKIREISKKLAKS
jgi:hypothetical protein